MIGGTGLQAGCKRVASGRQAGCRGVRSCEPWEEDVAAATSGGACHSLLPVATYSVTRFAHGLVAALGLVAAYEQRRIPLLFKELEQVQRVLRRPLRL